MQISGSSAIRNANQRTKDEELINDNGHYPPLLQCLPWCWWWCGGGWRGVGLAERLTSSDEEVKMEWPPQVAHSFWINPIAMSFAASSLDYWVLSQAMKGIHPQSTEELLYIKDPSLNATFHNHKPLNGNLRWRYPSTVLNWWQVTCMDTLCTVPYESYDFTLSHPFHLASRRSCGRTLIYSTQWSFDIRKFQQYILSAKATNNHLSSFLCSNHLKLSCRNCFGVFQCVTGKSSPSSTSWPAHDTRRVW